MVVGRAGRRRTALQRDRDRRLLQPLRGQAARLRGEVRLPRRRQLPRRCSRTHRSRRSSTPRPTACISRPPGMAAAAGKHVFLDKPIANTVAEGDAIARTCREAGVVLALGYQRRRESHFRWIKREIDAGRFGKLVQAEGNISRDRLGKIDLSSWRYPGRRHAGRRHAADRHPLCRRAGNAAGPGRRASPACSRSSCCRATIPTSPVSCSSTRTARSPT